MWIPKFSKEIKSSSADLISFENEIVSIFLLRFFIFLGRAPSPKISRENKKEFLHFLKYFQNIEKLIFLISFFPL